jgi:hypothetical protein
VLVRCHLGGQLRTQILREVLAKSRFVWFVLATALDPVRGRLVAGEVATDEQEPLLTPFRPGRFDERATRVVLDVEEVFG